MSDKRYGVDELQPLSEQLSEVCDSIQKSPHFGERHRELIEAAEERNITRLVTELHRVEKPLRYVSPLDRRPEVLPAKAAQEAHQEILNVYRGWALLS